MDCRRALAALLIGFGAIGATPSGELPLREAKWIAADQRLVLLTRPAPMCSRAAASPVVERQVELGELAFRTPLLLGGQAARAGLSCNSCHINGRSNPGFVFPGVSGAPGTADVTTSILSSHRGDGQFNPKRIPDLALDPPTVVTDGDDRALKAFIRGLIVEEFDGPEPTPATLAALAAFVRHQGKTDCQTRDASVASARAELALIAKALAIAEGDPGARALSLAAARAALGRLYERFPGKRFAREQAEILAMDESIRLAGQSATPLPDIMPLASLLQRAESRSLYNPRKLAKALK